MLGWITVKISSSGTTLISQSTQKSQENNKKVQENTKKVMQQYAFPEWYKIDTIDAVFYWIANNILQKM